MRASSSSGFSAVAARPSRAALLLLALAACDERPKPSADATGAPAEAATAAATTAPAADKPKAMPDLVVDDLGPFLGGKRVSLKDKASGRAKLEEVVKALPIEGKPVTLVAERRAKTEDVAAVVTALGAAGAPSVLVKTSGARKDLPAEITFTPQPKSPKPAPCSVATMIMGDLSTAVWPTKGGTGKRHRKGFAGPDLSHTGEALSRDLKACESEIAFVSGDDGILWEMTFNLAGTVLESDEKKKLKALVLLGDAPVAGRPLELGGS